MADLSIGAAQRQAWENKLAKGFNTTDVAFEFGLLVAEVGEAFTAWRHQRPDLGEELADCALFLVSLAEMNGVDLGAEMARKIAKNSVRRYERDGSGVLVKQGGQSDD